MSSAASSSTQNVDRTKYDCSISLESMINAESYVLPCGHSFGESIVSQVAEKIIKHCPECRVKIEKNPSKNYLLQESLRELDVLDKQNESLRAEVFVLRGENTQLKTDLKNYQQSLSSLSEKVDKCMMMVDNLSKENQELKNRLNNQQLVSFDNNVNSRSVERVHGPQIVLAQQQAEMCTILRCISSSFRGVLGFCN